MRSISGLASLGDSGEVPRNRRCPMQISTLFEESSSGRQNSAKAVRGLHGLSQRRTMNRIVTNAAAINPVLRRDGNSVTPLELSGDGATGGTAGRLNSGI